MPILLCINFLYLLRGFLGFSALEIKPDTRLLFFLAAYFFYLSVIKRGIDLENFKESAWSHGRFYGTRSKKKISQISKAAYGFVDVLGLAYIMLGHESAKKMIFVLSVLFSAGLIFLF